MNNNLEDNTVIIIIVFTIILVFVLIFSSIPTRNQLEPSIQWKEIPNQENSIDKKELRKKLTNLKINFKTANSIKESIESCSRYQNSITLVCGSLYLIGEILNLN